MKKMGGPTLLRFAVMLLILGTAVSLDEKKNPTVFEKFIAAINDVGAEQQDCSAPLGMENRKILDAMITASSSYNAAHGPSNGRLNFKAGGGKTGAWSAGANDVNQWLQVEFPRPTQVTQIQIQGREDCCNQFVKSYAISYSMDNKKFIPYGRHGVEVVFPGNKDKASIVTQALDQPIVATYIRIHPRSWSEHISMRVEFLGCGQECSNPLGLGNKGLPDSSFTASSSFNAGHGPSNGRLNFQAGGGKTGAWSARTNDVNQWLQIDLGQAVHINYIQTQGREDCCNQFVTSYTVSYSLDNIKYEKYQKYGKEVVFTGNSDKGSIATRGFYPPIYARFVRINPRSWSQHISMRAELLGCISDCSSEPLGMEDKSIRDVKITASSSYNAGHGPSNARLNFKAGGGKTGAWSAGANDANQWLKVEFDGPVQITDIQIQGREDCCDQFVRSYTVSYSSDNRNFISYKRGGQAAVFTGNTDRSSIATQNLFPPITATFIRIHPRTWSQHISMRLEFLGCKLDCSAPLGMENRKISDERITASSSYNAAHGPSNARLNFKAGGGKTGAWSAGANDVNQWLKVDVGRPVEISHIQTQGREDCCNQFVTTYGVSYSLDNKSFKTYQNNGINVVFTGNSDKTSIATRRLSPPIVARYVRIHPRTWSQHISMRVEFLGCDTDSRPAACRSYKEINEPDRSTQFSGKVQCDEELETAWYRFTGAGGTRMPEFPPDNLRCGTHAPGWLDGKHPGEADGVVTRTVCYRWNRKICRWKNEVKVLNCGGFFVYQLQAPPVCMCARYCVQKAPPLPEAAGIYPLNGASRFADITCKNAKGIASGVALAAGPDHQPDGAYEFAGNVNSFIEIPKSPALNTRYSISVLAWVHHDGQSGPIVQYRRDQWGYHFWLTRPNQLFVRPQQKGIVWKAAQVYNAQLAGAWHYVGATYDYATGMSALWVDGKKVVEQHVGTFELDTDAEIRIGVKANDGRFFKGRISCVQFYNRALSEVEIAAVKYRCLVPELPEPAGIYPLNGASKFADITCKNPAGTGSGVNLAPGPNDEADGAFEFLGNAGSFIEIPRSGPLDTRHSITVMAWVLHQGVSGPIIQYRRNNWGYHFWFTQRNQLFVRPQERGLKWKSAQAYTGSGLAGTWHFVGATYDHESGISSIWLDGEIVARQFVGTYDLDTDAEIRIGARLNDGRFFKGSISCVQIYNRALSKSEIAAVKERCFHGKRAEASPDFIA